MRTVVSAGAARDDFVSEGLLADLACILSPAIVQIQVIVVGTAPQGQLPSYVKSVRRLTGLMSLRARMSSALS